MFTFFILLALFKTAIAANQYDLDIVYENLVAELARFWLHITVQIEDKTVIFLNKNYEVKSHCKSIKECGPARKFKIRNYC